MLTLITGQPGNGKTLHALGLVEKLRQESGRPVFQSGILDLTLPWAALDEPEKWPDLPNGSIVIIDECQRVFPPRKQGAAVPRHVQEFETHRHRGFDIFLVTQHPQLLDINVRKLVGRHLHVKRNFGREVATISQWEMCVNPTDRAEQGKALRSKFVFPKERYGWYRSAEIHTVKKDFPVKPVAVLVGSLVAVVALGWFAAHRLMSQGEDSKVVSSVLPSPGEKAAADTWGVSSFVPRVPQWQWSAPFYEPVAKVASAPRIIGCMLLQIGNQRQCRCSDGQGDAQVTERECHDYMQGRRFDPLKPYEDIKAENIRRLDAASAGNDTVQNQGDGSGSSLNPPDTES